MEDPGLHTLIDNTVKRMGILPVYPGSVAFAKSAFHSLNCQTVSHIPTGQVSPYILLLLTPL